jgi:hypothetical protein
MSAQSYVVTEKETGNVVENGATYNIFDDGSSYWGVGEELFIEFEVTALEDVSLITEKVENNTVEYSRNYFCFDLCYGASTFISSPVDMSPGNPPTLLSMHYGTEYPHEYTELLGQTLNMTYYIYPADNPSDRFVINVTFKYSMDGIEDYNNAEMFSNPYPMPARDVVNFDYNFASNVVGEVAIFNMMGQEVMRSEINGMQGKASINVSDLADGIYFYSLIIDGKTEKSNKLIIRR